MMVNLDRKKILSVILDPQSGTASIKAFYLTEIGTSFFFFFFLMGNWNF